MEVKNKAAVVTGAGSGIGRGISLALAKAGADVMVVDIDLASAQKVADEVRALGRKAHAARCDVADPAAVEQLADAAFLQFPNLALVFNNAGVVATGMALDMTEKDLQWTFGVNVFGVWHGSTAFARRFIERQVKAWICNTCSENGLGQASIGTAIYTAAKHAVLGMTDALRSEYGDRLGFSVICPGIVKTGMWNAGRNRPEKFGGQFEGNPINQKAMNYGISPEDAGRHIVDAVCQEEFYIFTHAHVAAIAEKRWQEIDAAMRRQQSQIDAGSYSTIEIQSKVMAEFAAATAAPNRSHP
ncbi:MAG: short chain dehydrogenase family protein [Nevskia sp.]|nr:short chain dehydrogenase family protein [Nevskia sp.]